MNRRLNPDATPFIPKSTPSFPKANDWPPLSRTENKDDLETLEGIKRLNKWIAELEVSTSPQSEKVTPILRKSFPITDIKQSRTKFASEMKQLQNLAEETRTKCNHLELTISDLQATIKFQGALLNKTNVLDARSGEPILWHIPAFSTLYRKAKTSPNDTLNNIKNSFTSPIYTTHLTGCKISLRLFPYGANIFRGTHSSISCDLHPSDFTLPRTWPFEQQLIVSIIDQKDKNNKWSISFPYPSKTEEYEDPHKNDYTLPGLMREDFIAHTKLLVNFREAFLNNDSVIIQIQFDRPLFSKP